MINCNKFISPVLKFGITIFVLVILSCVHTDTAEYNAITASDLLGNEAYPAICYSGYRKQSREFEPSIAEIKSDLLLLHKLGYRLIRTYNVHYEHTANILKAISELTNDNSDFEMYVMLGIWINCEGAFSDQINHTQEDVASNLKEVNTALSLVKQYSDLVKIIAVGNEAMVHWQTNYFVGPEVILKWVNYLQNLKSKNQIPQHIWVTSSDNFASWGGGDNSYHNTYLEDLIKAVDFISLHTYPFHDTYYSTSLWSNAYSNDKEGIIKQMNEAVNYAIDQFEAVIAFTKSLGIDKPIHIGETGWATKSSDFYGVEGTNAADEFKQSLYFNGINDWANANKITVFFFEAFDEPWKDSKHPNGSENHFGLFTVKGKAKNVIWSENNTIENTMLDRNENVLENTFESNLDSLMSKVTIGKFFKYGV